MRPFPSNIFVIGIKILLRQEILDVQGKAIESSLRERDISQSDWKSSLVSCQVGKYIKIQLKETDSTQALLKAKEMAKFVLYNPLTETCEFEILSS